MIEVAENGVVFVFTDIPVATRFAAAVAAIIAAGIGGVGLADADPGGQIYGDPQSAARYWRYQDQQDCGLMAVADVVGQVTGHEPPQGGIQVRGMLTKSQAHRGVVYRFDGTAPDDLVVLLKEFGIQSQLSTGNSLTAVEQELAGGHKVIAALNAETIWNEPTGKRTEADHAVVVTGVDTSADVVHLNDSGIPTGRDEQVPLPTFTQAWATSSDLLIVTDGTGHV